MARKEVGTQMAEERLLGSLLYKPDKIVEVIDEINPDIFSVKEFGQIYRCILELYKDDIIPDEAMVIKKSEALGYEIAPELVKKLYNGKTFVAKRQLKEYCEVIKSSCFKRKTLELCTNFLERAKDISNPEAIISEFSSLTIELSDKIKSENNLSKISIDTKSVAEAVLHRFNNPNQMSGIPFGYPSIDMATEGACEGEIITLAGMNGGCKTYFALSTMKNMAKFLVEKI